MLKTHINKSSCTQFWLWSSFWLSIIKKKVIFTEELQGLLAVMIGLLQVIYLQFKMYSKITVQIHIICLKIKYVTVLCVKVCSWFARAPVARIISSTSAFWRPWRTCPAPLSVLDISAPFPVCKKSDRKKNNAFTFDIESYQTAVIDSRVRRSLQKT